MKTTDLADQIDKLVRDHLAQVQAEATAAIGRAFTSTSTRATKPKNSRRTRAAGDRRAPSLVAELAERLHAEVIAAPGESMTLYAKNLDASVRQLHRPMTLLKQAGRLRTTGARNNTRYFPTPSS